MVISLSKIGLAACPMKKGVFGRQTCNQSKWNRDVPKYFIAWASKTKDSDPSFGVTASDLLLRFFAAIGVEVLVSSTGQVRWMGPSSILQQFQRQKLTRFQGQLWTTTTWSDSSIYGCCAKYCLREDVSASSRDFMSNVDATDVQSSDKEFKRGRFSLW